MISQLTPSKLSSITQSLLQALLHVYGVAEWCFLLLLLYKLQTDFSSHWVDIPDGVTFREQQQHKIQVNFTFGL